MQFAHLQRLFFCAVVLDGTAENVSSAEVAEYEDDFEPEESEKSSVPNSDDGDDKSCSFAY